MTIEQLSDVTKPKVGDIVLVDLNSTHGFEQQSSGKGRPCVIIGGPYNWDTVVIVVPLTTTDRGWASHVPITNGSHKQRKKSIALCEQVRAIDTTRISRSLGIAPYDELQEIQRTTARLINVY